MTLLTKDIRQDNQTKVKIFPKLSHSILLVFCTHSKKFAPQFFLHLSKNRFSQVNHFRILFPKHCKYIFLLERRKKVLSVGKTLSNFCKITFWVWVDVKSCFCCLRKSGSKYVTTEKYVYIPLTDTRMCGWRTKVVIIYFFLISIKFFPQYWLLYHQYQYWHQCPYWLQYQYPSSDLYQTSKILLIKFWYQMFCVRFNTFFEEYC